MKMTVRALFSFNRNRRRKIGSTGGRDGIRLLGSFYECPQKWHQLSGKQRYALEKLQFAHMPRLDFLMSALFILLDAGRRPLLRMLLYFYVRREELFAMLPLAEWIIFDHTIWHKGKPHRIPLKMNFLQFIRLDSEVRKMSDLDEKDIREGMANVLTAAFTPYATPFTDETRLSADHFAGLSEMVMLSRFNAALEGYNQIMAKWPTVFPKSESTEGNTKKSKPNHAYEWAKIMRSLAGDALEMERFSQLDADAVLFELAERIKEKKQLEQKLKQ